MSNPDDKRQRLAVLGGGATSAPGLPSRADTGVCAVSLADWRKRPTSASLHRDSLGASAAVCSSAQHTDSVGDCGERDHENDGVAL